jgi:hypothetical protein
LWKKKLRDFRIIHHSTQYFEEEAQRFSDNIPQYKVLERQRHKKGRKMKQKLIPNKKYVLKTLVKALLENDCKKSPRLKALLEEEQLKDFFRECYEEEAQRFLGNARQ